MKFNTLFVFLTILVIVSFVVAMPTDDFDKLKKRDIDNELKELMNKHDELKGYDLDELKEIVHSNGLDTETVGPDDLHHEILRILFEHLVKKIGSALISRCRTNHCI